jgi:plastocyanin
MARRLIMCLIASVACFLSMLDWASAVAPSGVSQATPRHFEVRIISPHVGFNPNAFDIQVGDTVTWINDDQDNAHSATADSTSVVKFVEVDLTSPGASTRVTFMTAGKATYHCKYHPGMKGSLTVNAATR